MIVLLESSPRKSRHLPRQRKVCVSDGRGQCDSRGVRVEVLRHAIDRGVRR
jgi:hypothetical protein